MEEGEVIDNENREDYVIIFPNYTRRRTATTTTAPTTTTTTTTTIAPIVEILTPIPDDVTEGLRLFTTPTYKTPWYANCGGNNDEQVTGIYVETKQSLPCNVQLINIQ